MTNWVRFRIAGSEHFGVLQGGWIQAYVGDMFGENAPDGSPLRLSETELLTPCVPRTYIGLWNNFRSLATKTGAPEPSEPLYFIKAPSCTLLPGGVIRRPPNYSGKVIFEGELGIVVGKPCSNADEDQAAQAIFGYTCVNDVTAIEWLTSVPNFPQWTRAKGCDTFGPFGPTIATDLNWSTLTIRSHLNGRERQNYPANDMILSPARTLSLLSREITLMPGDLIACGTSLGVAPLRPGDRIDIQIEGIGILSNVIAETPAE